MILLIYIITINVIAYYMMWKDKKAAINHEWRIPEKSLFISAIAGGALGIAFGMKAPLFHKVNKWYFKYGIPFVLAIQICLAFAVRHWLGQNVL